MASLQFNSNNYRSQPVFIPFVPRAWISSLHSLHLDAPVCSLLHDYRGTLLSDWSRNGWGLLFVQYSFLMVIQILRDNFTAIIYTKRHVCGLAVHCLLFIEFAFGTMLNISHPIIVFIKRDTAHTE